MMTFYPSSSQKVIMLTLLTHIYFYLPLQCTTFTQLSKHYVQHEQNTQ